MVFGMIYTRFIIEQLILIIIFIIIGLHYMYTLIILNYILLYNLQIYQYSFFYFETRIDTNTIQMIEIQEFRYATLGQVLEQI